MGSSSSKGPAYSPDLAFNRKGGAKYAVVKKILDNERGEFCGKVEDQTYSCVQSYKEFREHRGKSDRAQLDLCVLGAKKLIPSKAELRPCQDDAIVIQHNHDYMLGVFDGHGRNGERLASTAVADLYRIFTASTTSLTDVKLTKKERERSTVEFDYIFDFDFVNNVQKSMEETFRRLHKTITTANDFEGKEAGTTATLALVKDDMLHLAWVGDSRATLFVATKEDYSDLTSFNVTSTHNFQTEEELKRIEESPAGCVRSPGHLRGKPKLNAGPLRLYRKGADEPGLMISKSLGDKISHTHYGLTCEPDYLELPIRPKTFGELRQLIPEAYQEEEAPPEPTRRGRGQSIIDTLKRPFRKKKKGLASQVSVGESTASVETPLLTPGRVGAASEFGSQQTSFRSLNQNNNSSLTLMKQPTLQEIERAAAKAPRGSNANDKSGITIDSTDFQTQPKRTGSIISLKFFKRGRASLNRANRSTGISNTNTVTTPVLPNDDAEIKHMILVIASDGLWDGLKTKEVCAKIRNKMQSNSKENLSLSLAVQAQEGWNQRVKTSSYIDDVSVITAVLY